MIPLKTQAIQTALLGDWTTAVDCNQKILEETPEDIDALNRLAFAYASLGNLKEAKNIYQKVLNLDAQNPIALRNLKRFSSPQPASTSSIKVNNIFIEEPGKTKVIDLINVAEQKLISLLRSGEMLDLVVKRMKIFALDSQKQYIGMLPDDLGNRLIRLMNGGNQYEAYVKTVNNRRVTIFVKETRRSPKFKYLSSFASSEKPKFVLDNSAKRLQKNMRMNRKSHHEGSEIDSP